MQHLCPTPLLSFFGIPLGTILFIYQVVTASIIEAASERTSRGIVGQHIRVTRLVIPGDIKCY
jgi:hypothetical protein